MVRILHTGDIHLDTPFSSLPPKQSEIMRNELRGAFTSLMTFADLGNVDIILIAGDMFEQLFVTRETVKLMRDEFEKLTIPIVITPGNHDPAGRNSIWLKDIFPSNVHIFKSEDLEKISFDELGIDLYGYAFTTSQMDSCPFDGRKVDDPDKINILCAHGDMTSPLSNKCPINERQILSFGADYTALGHIHNPGPIVRKDDKVYAYCGCLQGRDFGETGEKGAVLSDIEKSYGQVTIKAQRKIFSKRIFRNCVINVDEAETEDDIVGAVEKYIIDNKFMSDTLLYAKLQGSVSVSLSIDTGQLSSRIASDTNIFSLLLVDETRPVWDAEYLKNDIGIKGEFYRSLENDLDSPDPDTRIKAKKALKYGLASLSGDNVIDY